MVFKRDLTSYRPALERDGYVLLKDILSDKFMAYLKAFHDRSKSGDVAEYNTWRIGGKKQQFLFDFPSQEEALEFRDGIAALTGMAEERIATSERHLKQYEVDAPDYPAPHKDRGASKYSIGLPIHLGPGSSICIFPALDRSPNLGDRAVFMTPQDHPGLEGIYNSPDALVLNEELGDMVVFLGSTMYHERIRARGTAVLYVKVNDEGFDPIGEDIFGAAKAMETA